MSYAKLLAPTTCWSVAVFPSPLGWMAVAGTGTTLKELTFGHLSPAAARAALRPEVGAGGRDEDWNPELVERLQAYAAGAPDNFLNIAIDLSGASSFQRRVTACCREIPFATTRTYGELALKADAPRAARAVGRVMATNRIPLVVPCHRVVPTSGGLGNYSAPGGIRTKLRLLEIEGLNPTSSTSQPFRQLAVFG